MKEKNLTPVLVVLLAGALVLSASAIIPAARAQSQTPQVPQFAPIRTLSVTGTGKVVLVPDMAYINVGVHSEADDVTSAVAANNDLAKQLSDALIAEGVKAEEIQTTNFNVYQAQRYDPQGVPSGTYFSVDNTINITVRDLPRLGELLDVALRAGANTIYGIQFDLADREAALAQARDLAIKDAQEKAKAVADVSDVELGEVQSINVSNTTYVQPYPVPYGMGGGVAREDSASVPIASGQIVVSFDANLIFQIN